MSTIVQTHSAFRPESGIQLDQFYDGFELPYEEVDFEALGINPLKPTPAKPGSDAKVSMLAARYAAGLPLWHDEDCSDHGPMEQMLLERQSAMVDRAEAYTI